MYQSIRKQHLDLEQILNFIIFVSDQKCSHSYVAHLYSMDDIPDTRIIFSMYSLPVSEWLRRMHISKLSQNKIRGGGHSEIQRLRNTGVDNLQNPS